MQPTTDQTIQLGENLSLYNKKYGSFYIDDGLLKLFTFNKDLCDFIEVSLYNLTTARKFYFLAHKVRRPLYHNNINYEQMVLDTLTYARLRDLANKILTKVSLYNSNGTTTEEICDIFTAENEELLKSPEGKSYNNKTQIVGKLRITPKKVSLSWDDVSSDKTETIFTLDNSLNLFIEMMTLVQEQLMDAHWCQLPSYIFGIE